LLKEKAIALLQDQITELQGSKAPEYPHFGGKSKDNTQSSEDQIGDKPQKKSKERQKNVFQPSYDNSILKKFQEGKQRRQVEEEKHEKNKRQKLDPASSVTPSSTNTKTEEVGE